MLKDILKYISIFVIFCICLVFINESLSFSSDNDIKIRVLILKNAEKLVISISGRYKIVDEENGNILYEGRDKRKKRVKIKNGRIMIGKAIYASSNIRMSSNKWINFYKDNKRYRYRDDINLILNKDEKLVVVNSINLEEYVKGVLYHEISNRWPIEATKAQAIAVRTYAVYQWQINKNRSYDVTSDIYSQVYGGKNAERFRTNMAVNRTKGKVLGYKGEILPAYYHSICGGHTEDVKNLWDHDLKPLSGRVCTFCKNSPNYRWEKNFRSQDIQEKLIKNGFRVGLIKEIKITKKTKAGRVEELLINSRDGKSVKITGKKFRSIVGPNNLKSNFYDIEMKGYYFDVNGRGWGHGVGMCQWGAYHMAKQHYKYDKILKYYYPRSNISDINIFIQDEN